MKPSEESRESDRKAAVKYSRESTAALNAQKVYRSCRTRSRLGDSSGAAEELWWQAIDYVKLNYRTTSFVDYLKPESARLADSAVAVEELRSQRMNLRLYESTVSFFDDLNPETAQSRWRRIRVNASKVGKGLSKDKKAKKLSFMHWIEAIDPWHRYGRNLHFYYEEWSKVDAGQPFFYWLDIGDGKDVDIQECPRSLLQQQCIRYLTPQERENYEYVPKDGRIIHKQTGELIDTTQGSEQSKWIFVLSTTKKLYAGQKKKGVFHHSSFLAGGATLAAGRFAAENGKIKIIWPYSGYYRPTEENLKAFLSYLEENGIKLDEIEM